MTTNVQSAIFKRSSSKIILDLETVDENDEIPVVNRSKLKVHTQRIDQDTDPSFERSKARSATTLGPSFNKSRNFKKKEESQKDEESESSDSSPTLRRLRSWTQIFIGKEEIKPKKKLESFPKPKGKY